MEDYPADPVGASKTLIAGDAVCGPFTDAKAWVAISEFPLYDTRTTTASRHLTDMHTFPPAADRPTIGVSFGSGVLLVIVVAVVAALTSAGTVYLLQAMRVAGSTDGSATRTVPGDPVLAIRGVWELDVERTFGRMFENLDRESRERMMDDIRREGTRQLEITADEIKVYAEDAPAPMRYTITDVNGNSVRVEMLVDGFMRAMVLEVNGDTLTMAAADMADSFPQYFRRVR